MAHRQNAAKHNKNDGKQSQPTAHVLTNTARRSLFKASAGGVPYFRKIAEKRTDCLSAIQIEQDDRFTSR